MNEEKGVSKERVIKILLPVLIIIGIIIVWKVKDANTTPIIQNTEVTHPLHVTEVLDLEELKSYGLPIVIDFGADECDPCKAMAPVLVELNETLDGKAIILFVDVWKYPELGDGYPLSSIPTQLFIDKDGKPYVPSEENSRGMTSYSTKDTNEHIFTTHVGGVTKKQLLAILYEMGMEK